MVHCVVVVSWFAAGSGGTAAAAAAAVAAAQHLDGSSLVAAVTAGGNGSCQLAQQKYEICEKTRFLKFVVTQEEKKRTEIKKIELNRLIHLKTVLVKDHV